MQKEAKLFSFRKIVLYTLFALIFIGVSIASIVVIYHKTNSQHFNIFALFTWDVFVNLAILLLFYYLVDTLRFYYMFKALNVDVKFLYMFRLNFVNIFVSNITPFATGGGIGQIYFLHQKKVSLADASAAVFVRAIISIACFLIIVPFILLMNNDLVHVFPSDNNIVITVVTLVIYSLAIIFFYNLVVNTRLVKAILYRFFDFLYHKNLISRKKYQNAIRASFRTTNDFSRNMRMFLRGKKRYVFLSFAFTPLYILALCSFPAVLIKGIDQSISSTLVISLQVLVTFVTYFVPTPGATGAAEGSFYYVFQNLISEDMMAQVIFLWRFTTIHIGVIIGFFVVAFELGVIAYRKRRIKAQNDATKRIIN